MRDLVERGILQPLAENVYFIPAPREGRFPFCHGFLLTGPETVLIDAGVGGQNIKEIDRRRRIDILVVSHPHPDHILSWQLLEDRRLLFPMETPETADLYELGLRFTGTPENGRYWAKGVGKVLGLKNPRPPDGRFGDGEVLEIGGALLEAIHAPGHLVDHYCFLERRTGTLITTDIDFTSFGPFYANAESDAATFEASVRKVMAYPYRRAVSSHKPPREGDNTDRFEAFLEAFRRQRRLVYDLCDPPRTLEEMAALSPFYNHRMPDKGIQRIFEPKMILDNLKILIREGLVEESGGRYGKTGADAGRLIGTQL